MYLVVVFTGLMFQYSTMKCQDVKRAVYLSEQLCPGWLVCAVIRSCVAKKNLFKTQYKTLDFNAVEYNVY